MTDVFTPEKRSAVMRRVKGRDTAPEMKVRRMLRTAGIGYRLGGCGLPAAWANTPQWRILETGFGFGLNFLVTWAAWKADPQRPRMLHFTSVEAYPVSAADLLAPTNPAQRTV